MESTEDYLKRTMGQFTSAKKVKIVKPTNKVSEQTEQLNFCKWLKHNYPEVLFRSDIQSSANKTPFMQNMKQILDPYSGWPDVMVYLPKIQTELRDQGADTEYIESAGLGIEMKSLTASLSGEHHRNQLAMHERLGTLGWDVYVCRGAEEAKKVFLEYYNK